MDNLEIYLIVALGISESVALLPKLKGNGILDMAIKVLKSLVKK